MFQTGGTEIGGRSGHVNNKDIAVLPLWSSGVTVANDKVYGLAAGVRHSF